MALSSYSTGTVTVAANGTTVTGAGAIWSGVNVRPGDILQIGNFQTVITDVTDTSHLVIPPWGGGAQTGAAYTIWQWYPQRVAGALAQQDVSDLIAKLGTDGLLWYLPAGYTDPNDVRPPLTADDGQGILKIDTGALWVMQGGTWVSAGTYKGFNPRGAYDNSATYSNGDYVSSGGSSYVFINPTPSAGHVPPNALYWSLLAAQGRGYGGTSATSATITNSAPSGIAFQTQANLAYLSGNRVRANAASDATKWMEGVVDYNATTGFLTLYPDLSSGSGTFSSWNFAIAGARGAAGTNGTNGTNAPTYGGTTLTSMTVGTGSKTFTTQAGLAYQPGARIRIWASGGQWMEGIIQTYSGTSMNVTVDKAFGSGTIASWNINIAGEPGSGDILSTNNGSDFASIAQVRRNLALPILARGYISGLTLSTAGGAVSFSVAPGVCVDSNVSPSFASGGDFMFLTGSLSKIANAAWVAGGGGGSLDAGSYAANVWYHVYVIKNPTTAATDILTSTSATSPTLPSGYSMYRRIGSIWSLPASGLLNKFLQAGDEFYHDVPIQDVGAFSLSNTHTLLSLSVPPGVSVMAMFQANFTNTAAPATALLYPVVITNQVPGTPSGNFNINNQVANQFGASWLDIRTNTSGQIGARASNGSNNLLYLITKGWRDGRGRFD